uniref:RRM domain-containing protein n=3 Tax=Bombyx mori TaxID=7091 RepID=A0A8R2DL55_BOMMO|nr:uncharacterized protein LOC101739668 isoform X1 [Bombyx mori]
MWSKRIMSNHSRPQRRREWDPMRDDFNEHTYDVQYADDNAGEQVQLDHTKLYIINIPRGLSEDGIRAAFSKHGKVLSARLSKNPNKRFAIVQFETASEAKLAMMKMNGSEPLNLKISIAHKTIRKTQHDNKDRNYSTSRNGHCSRDEASSISSKGWNMRNLDDVMNNDEIDEIDDMIHEDHDDNLDLELDMLTLKQLKIKEEQLMCKRRLLLRHAEKRQVAPHSSAGRSVLPDGRIVVRNNANETDSAEVEPSFAGAGSESSETLCSCLTKTCDRASVSSASTTACDKCAGADKAKSTIHNKTDIKSSDSRAPMTDPSSQFDRCHFDICDLDDSDSETTGLIQLRSTDYAGAVEERLKVVIAFEGYPKSSIRLRQMESFQRCLNTIIEMQLHNGLLKETPSFVDYYLNRGAIVVVCKDLESRDWIVRVFPGLEERMKEKIVLLNSTVKRVYLAVMKLPRTCWPMKARDVFKLLQYFNPKLKTVLWKIYSQKVMNGVEVTSFIMDRVSGEIVRGYSFNNVIDYSQMEFDMIGQREIYFEPLSGLDEDISSVASRVKLLAEIKSAESTPKTSQISLINKAVDVEKVIKVIEAHENEEKVFKFNFPDPNEDPESSFQQKVLDKLKDVQYVGEDREVFVWSKDLGGVEDASNDGFMSDSSNVTSAPLSYMSEGTDLRENLYVDSSKRKPYYRRTNYLHVEPELKVAVTLEGYPTDKLEAPHMKLMKRAFKDFVHKDAKMKRFDCLMQPHFHDVYLANGALIYICNCIESKDYLLEVLPKLILATGLRLSVRDIKDLVRYTRVVFRLPKEIAHKASEEVLNALKKSYSGLKIECWKYYSSVIGKQRREFGLDPESLLIIKSPEFKPTYEGHILEFRIIDRTQKYLKECERACVKTEETSESEKRNQEILNKIYNPINPSLKNLSLSKIRADHYSDFIDDDLKLYIGSVNYPEIRIDLELFNTIKTTFEKILLESIEKGVMGITNLPVFHDVYLFDGVIFVICQNMASRRWIENSLSSVNSRLGISLKHTEYRGAVGIISMSLQTSKTPERVIEALQIRNPRLRTRFWRVISTVQTKNNLNIVLQIDKFSAQIITSKDFVNVVGKKCKVHFKLGHLMPLLDNKSKLTCYNNNFEKLTTIEEYANIENLEATTNQTKTKKNKKKSKNKKGLKIPNTEAESKITLVSESSNDNSTTDTSKGNESVRPTDDHQDKGIICNINNNSLVHAIMNVTKKNNDKQSEDKRQTKEPNSNSDSSDDIFTADTSKNNDEIVNVTRTEASLQHDNLFSNINNILEQAIINVSKQNNDEQTKVEIFDEKTKENNDQSNNSINLETNSKSVDNSATETFNYIQEHICEENTDASGVVRNFEEQQNNISVTENNEQTVIAIRLDKEELLKNSIGNKLDVLAADNEAVEIETETIGVPLSEDDTNTKDVTDSTEAIPENNNFELINEDVMIEKETPASDFNDNIIETSKTQSPHVSDPESDLNTNGLQKILLRIPIEILPEEEDLNMVFEVLKNKNPGLNPEVWKMHAIGSYDKGKFVLHVDDESMNVIKGSAFNNYVGGRRIFFFY